MDNIDYISGFLTDTYGDKLLVMAMLPVMFMIVILLHEFGHYFMARLFGVRVERFRIGYGRVVWNKTDRHGTHWRIRLLPLSGMVHLLGQRRAELEEMKGKGYSPDQVFCLKPVWQRALIVAAGPMMNVIIAFVAFFIIFSTVGQPSTPPYISGVEIDGPADEAGFRPGDKVLTFQGQAVKRFEQITRVTKKETQVPLDFTVERGGRVLPLSAVSRAHIYKDKDGIERERGRIGVLYLQEPLQNKWVYRFNGRQTRDDPDLLRELILESLGEEVVLGVWSADRSVHDYRAVISPVFNDQITDPAHQEYDSFYAGTVRGNVYLQYGLAGAAQEALKETGRLLSGVGKLPLQLIPIDTENIKTETSVARHRAPLKHDLYTAFYMTALLSVVIALINLLPFPGLDGSFLLMYAAEGIVGADMAESLRPYLLRMAIVLFSLIIAISHADVISTIM